MWIIEDWMSNRVFPDKTFGSFDEARGFISDHASATAKNEEEHDGICEDLYAVERLDPTDAITVETQQEAHDLAVAYSNWEGKSRLRLDELNEWVYAFEKLAERFPDLEDEFRENALI